jgi:hypothetical protein
MQTREQLQAQKYAMIEQWQQSGLSQKKYCEHNNIAYHRGGSKQSPFNMQLQYPILLKVLYNQLYLWISRTGKLEF